MPSVVELFRGHSLLLLLNAPKRFPMLRAIRFQYSADEGVVGGHFMFGLLVRGRACNIYRIRCSR